MKLFTQFGYAALDVIDMPSGEADIYQQLAA